MTDSSARIDFTTVSREFQSLVVRRRELMTLLASIFAGLGIFLQNALQGNFPPALRSLEPHLFAYYALVLMVASLLLSLRMARLHGGMVLNGILFARLMQEQDFSRRGDPQRAARHNYAGASFLQFVLVDLIAGFSATVLSMALGSPLWIAVALGGAIFIVWLIVYFHFHRRAVRFAFDKIARETCAPFDRQEWEGHTSASLENVNHDMLGCIGFVGLMMFSAIETLSGLGLVRPDSRVDLPAQSILQHGPIIYTSLMTVTCLFQLAIYTRLRVALGRCSLDADPTDRPFQPLKLTDSFLGYLLLCFLFAVALHLQLTVALDSLTGSTTGIVLFLDAACLVAAVAAEQITLVVAGRRYGTRPTAPAAVPPAS